jgi:hypothetical protein
MTTIDQCLRRACEDSLQAASFREGDYRRTLTALASVFDAIRRNAHDSRTVSDLSEMALSFLADQTGITP